MRVLGWVLFAATVLMFVLQTVFLAVSDVPLLSYDTLVDHAFPLVGFGAVIGAGIGALIINRHPRNVIGWLFLAGQLGNAFGLACEAFTDLVAQGIVEAPVAGRIARYLDSIFDATYTISILAVIFMIVPDGRLLSRRWRVAIAVPIASLALHFASIVTQPASNFTPGASLIFDDLTLWLLFVSFSLLLLSVVLGAISLVLRMLRATGELRLQLLWISIGAVAVALIFVLFALSDFWLDPIPWVLTEALYLAYIFVSVSVGVAILKYRLYDIDVILNRAIVLGVLVVFVTVGYIAVVVAIGAVLVAVGTSASTPQWPSLVAVALVAVAFQPVRRHVLRLADQLVYGSRAAPYEALAALSRRLADSPSPAALPERVAEATGRAVGATLVVVTLGQPEHRAPLRTATWSEPAASAVPGADPTVVLPVQDMGERVGSIAVTMPPGRALRTFERDLIDDVAAQAGVAFRNALLEVELAARVAEGEATSAELAASRRRLVGVEDDAREALAAAIRREVVPHLATVESELSAAAPPKPASAAAPPTSSAEPASTPLAGERLERLIGSSERALEELRIVCRGVFPALLERRGLVPALSAQLDSTHPSAQLQIDGSARVRLDRAAEAAGYVFCTEVTPRDLPSAVTLEVSGGGLVIKISAAGAWAAGMTESDLDGDPAAIVPWQHARDRVAALDGVIRMHSREDAGLTVSAVIPLTDQPDREPAMSAQISSSRSGPNADFDT